MENSKSTALGIFYGRKPVEDVLSVLLGMGYNPAELSVVKKSENGFANVPKRPIRFFAPTWITTGAVLGGAAGLLSLTVLPGLASFFVGGAIVWAMGLSGAIATILSGALTGLLAGWLLGLLVLSLEATLRDIAEYGGSETKHEGIMLAVPVRAGDENAVREIMEQNGGAKVIILNHKAAESQGEDRGLQSNFIRTQPAYYNQIRRAAKKKSKKRQPI